MGEGLSLDKRIRMGHKLGWTRFARFESDEPDVSSKSVAAFSSLYMKGCNKGYLQENQDNIK